MNINANAYFATEPSVHIQRSVFSRPSERCFTGNIGELIPFYVDEVLPGDTVKIKTSKVLRLQTLLSPFMGNLVADFSWWYCPNNILWSHWNNLMGENTASKWIPAATYTTPSAAMASSAAFPKGSIADYLGLPTEFATGAINALPIRAYHKIWNDFWRDQNVQDPVLLTTGDSQSPWTDDTTYYLYDRYIMPRPVNRFHDYFSSCLPAPQKGPDVRIPSGMDLLHVGTTDTSHDPIFKTTLGAPYPIVLENISDSTIQNTLYTNSSDWKSGTLTNGNARFPNNLYAVLGDSALGTISDLRTAFQIQKLYERDARSGTRYQEILAAHFGTNAPDSALYRPQYLGGNRVNINVSQVINNAASSGEYLGDLGGMSQTVDVHADFTRSFTQHGVLLGLMCIRYMPIYSQGRARIWDRSDRFSYYWPEFAHISNQPVFKKELYGDVSDAGYDEVFGYQEYAAEYRYMPSYVAGEMRPGQSYSFDSWSVADYYSNCPTLSDTWMRVDKGNVDRVLAVTSAAAHQFWADIFIENISTRPMPVRSIPGLADHF